MRDERRVFPAIRSALLLLFIGCSCALEAAGTEPAPAAGAAAWVRPERLQILLIAVFLLALLAWYAFTARRRTDAFIRRIPGLEEFDHAVGRAAEQGRPVLFIPGILEMSDIQTVAGVNLLGHVAARSAALGVPLLAPMARPFAMSVAQETVRRAYVEQGRSELFQSDNVRYLTSDQFGYAAGAVGVMTRSLPGACFYLGSFSAESMLLAETGNAVGAVQIAGTADVAQIPFFVVACDYTLIGEELFAASAYLTRRPEEIGALKGMDACKLVIAVLIVCGALLATARQWPALAGAWPLRSLDGAVGWLLTSESGGPAR
ncbi:MAG TPA: hypothetical protein PLP29_13385 [Candidatus Ozemobacteraceae bacterium]|nr:hypothetical protein [Candidatus Ozemobacteraceae bacterium]